MNNLYFVMCLFAAGPDSAPMAPRIAFVAMKDATVGGRLLLACAMGTAEPCEVRRKQGGSPNRRAYLTVGRKGSANCFAAMNDLGLAVALVPGIDVGPNVAGEMRAAQLLENAVAQADSYAGARAMLESDDLPTPVCFLVGDARAGEALAIERIGPRSAVFGPGDSAEKSAPFFPLANVVRRCGGFADPSMRAAAVFEQRHQNADANNYVELSHWLSDARPLTAEKCLQAFRAIPANDASTCSAVLDPLGLRCCVETRSGGRSTGVETVQLGSAAPAKQGKTLAGSAETAAALREPNGAIARSMIAVAPRLGDDGVPTLFRLDRASFAAETEPWQTIAGVQRFKIRFPSPVVSPHPENNTVHAEFFRPFGTGPFRTAIVLHIAGGDFELSRFMSQMLAQQGTACLFVKMPYYGERRPKTGRIRMLSDDLETGIAAMRQNILDLRRACDWIQGQPECDSNKVAVVGVSLGAIAGSLLAAIDPRVTHACLIMGGARYENILFESVEREARESKTRWLATGRTRDDFGKAMTPIDPATYADRLKDRKVLLICADDDKTIPMASTLALWEATGRQPIHWYPCGHYTMAKYLLPALAKTSKFLRDWPTSNQ